MSFISTVSKHNVIIDNLKQCVLMLAHYPFKKCIIHVLATGYMYILYLYVNLVETFYLNHHMKILIYDD